MSRPEIVRQANDLAWSMWTELGVPGVLRRHQRVAVDPEPLVVASPRLAAGDPRLLELIYSWCADHEQRLSASRIQGLHQVAAPSVQRAFAELVATLRRDGAVRWSVDASAEPWSTSPERRPVQADLSRPALLRLRLRALCGVGARADVLAELLGRRAAWTRASDLSDEGYSKRNVGRILAELHEAGLVEGRTRGRTHLFRLPPSSSLDALVGAPRLRFPRWRLALDLVASVLDLADQSERSAATRRVEAHKVAERLRPVAQELGLPTPPPTKGDPQAWEGVMGWAVAQTTALAAGSSDAFS